MPFSIDCVCEAENLKVCEITELKLVVIELGMPYGSCKFLGGPEDIVISATGDYPLTPLGSWSSVWDNLYVWMKADRSLASDVDDSFIVRFYIEATFVCEDFESNTSTFVVRLMNQELNVDECTDDDGVFRAFASTGAGVIGGAIVSSSPLASCQGFEIQSGDFDDINNLQVVDVSTASSGTVCLCPSGGTPPYGYSLTGMLPSGVTFNPATGCFEGLPDGYSAGDNKLVIDAYDASHPSEHATVTCQYRYCPPSGRKPNNYAF